MFDWLLGAYNKEPRNKDGVPVILTAGRKIPLKLQNCLSNHCKIKRPVCSHKVCTVRQLQMTTIVHYDSLPGSLFVSASFDSKRFARIFNHRY